MTRFEPELIITQSLLDRLTDEDPASGSDVAITRAQSFRQFKVALRRDLEWLLNTRQTPLPADEKLKQVSSSLYNYGLPDLAAVSAQSTHDRNRLRWMLETTVGQYEPRLADIRVSMEPLAPNSRMLRFRIEAMARVDPAPEQVSFDTVLELTSGEYEVK